MAGSNSLLTDRGLRDASRCIGRDVEYVRINYDAVYLSNDSNAKRTVNHALKRIEAELNQLSDATTYETADVEARASVIVDESIRFLTKHRPILVREPTPMPVFVSAFRQPPNPESTAPRTQTALR